MENPSQEEIVSLVNSMFKVSDFTKAEFSLEFRIEDLEFKSKFEDLARRLENANYVCKLEEMNNSKYIVVQKFTPKRRRLLSSSWTPRILFSVVVVFVMIDGYFKTDVLNAIVYIGQPVEMAIIYTVSLLGILGVHELGHMVAARIHRLKTTWPFFIPGLPIIGIPTFGALIQSKGLTINRHILFDVAIAGPIAGLIIAIIVSIYGAYTAPIIAEVQHAEQMFEAGNLSDFTFGEPLFLKGALALFGKGMPGTEVILTPVLWAAWIGFFITFLNLMPAWQLDGGHLARTIFGIRIHKFTTYASFIVMAVIGFELAALLFYFWSRGSFSAQPLDDISPLSKNRKLIYVGIIVLAVLCVPIPENLCLPLVRTPCIF